MTVLLCFRLEQRLITLGMVHNSLENQEETFSSNFSLTLNPKRSIFRMKAIMDLVCHGRSWFPSKMTATTKLGTAASKPGLMLIISLRI